ncbi:unnamed protein product [Amoebophrya sp. A120]|nr:unnamed protein product [Amoebophrya sp. A120]|eukprot:GSA120T00022680001.1
MHSAKMMLGKFALLLPPVFSYVYGRSGRGGLPSRAGTSRPVAAARDESRRSGDRSRALQRTRRKVLVRTNRHKVSEASAASQVQEVHATHNPSPGERIFPTVAESGRGTSSMLDVAKVAEPVPVTNTSADNASNPVDQHLPDHGLTSSNGTSGLFLSSTTNATTGGLLYNIDEEAGIASNILAGLIILIVVALLCSIPCIAAKLEAPPTPEGGGKTDSPAAGTSTDAANTQPANDEINPPGGPFGHTSALAEVQQPLLQKNVEESKSATGAGPQGDENNTGEKTSTDKGGFFANLLKADPNKVLSRGVHPRENRGKVICVFIILLVINMLVNVDAGALAVVLQVLRNGYQSTPMQEGVLLFITYFGLAIAAYPGGKLLQNHSQKTVLTIGMACNGLATCALAVSPSVWTMVASRFFVGGTQVFAVVYVCVWAPEFAGPGSENMWLSLALICGPVGSLLGYQATGLLPETYWRYPLGCCGGIILCTAIALSRMSHEYIDDPWSSPRMAKWRELYAKAHGQKVDHLPNKEGDSTSGTREQQQADGREAGRSGHGPSGAVGGTGDRGTTKKLAQSQPTGLRPADAHGSVGEDIKEVLPLAGARGASFLGLHLPDAWTELTSAASISHAPSDPHAIRSPTQKSARETATVKTPAGQEQEFFPVKFVSGVPSSPSASDVESDTALLNKQATVVGITGMNRAESSETGSSQTSHASMSTRPAGATSSSSNKSKKRPLAPEGEAGDDADIKSVARASAGQMNPTAVSVIDRKSKADVLKQERQQGAASLVEEDSLAPVQPDNGNIMPAEDGLEEADEFGVCDILKSGIFVGCVCTLCVMWCITNAIQSYITIWFLDEFYPVDEAYADGEAPEDPAEHTLWTRATWKSHVLLIYTIILVTGPPGGVVLGGVIADRIGYVGLIHRIKYLYFIVADTVIAALLCFILSCSTGGRRATQLYWFASLSGTMVFFGAMLVPGLAGMLLTVIPHKSRALASACNNFATQMIGFGGGTLVPALAASLVTIPEGSTPEEARSKRNWASIVATFCVVWLGVVAVVAMLLSQLHQRKKRVNDLRDRFLIVTKKREIAKQEAEDRLHDHGGEQEAPPLSPEEEHRLIADLQIENIILDYSLYEIKKWKYIPDELRAEILMALNQLQEIRSELLALGVKPIDTGLHDPDEHLHGEESSHLPDDAIANEVRNSELVLQGEDGDRTPGTPGAAARSVRGKKVVQTATKQPSFDGATTKPTSKQADEEVVLAVLDEEFSPSGGKQKGSGGATAKTSVARSSGTAQKTAAESRTSAVYSKDKKKKKKDKKEPKSYYKVVPSSSKGTGSMMGSMHNSSQLQSVSEDGSTRVMRVPRKAQPLSHIPHDNETEYQKQLSLLIQRTHLDSFLGTKTNLASTRPGLPPDPGFASATHLPQGMDESRGGSSKKRSVESSAETPGPSVSAMVAKLNRGQNSDDKSPTASFDITRTADTQASEGRDLISRVLGISLDTPTPPGKTKNKHWRTLRTAQKLASRTRTGLPDGGSDNDLKPIPEAENERETIPPAPAPAAAKSPQKKSKSSDVNV